MSRKLNTSLLLTLGMALLFAGCGGGDEQAASSQRGGGRTALTGNQAGALPVKVDTVRSGSISKYILTNSTLEAQRAVDVIARVAGIVEGFHFEEGTVVKKGDLLVKLDERETKLNMEQAKARADNTLRLHNRSKEMFERNLVSKEAFDDTKFQYETASSQFESARLQWQYTSIVAPISGIITSRQMEIGDYITANRVVCSIADYDTLLARIYIPERDISKIRPDQTAKITVEALAEKEFNAKVQMVNPVVDPASGTVKVTVEIPRRNTGLLPGMFSTIFLLTDTRDNTVIVPKKSLVLESETDRVFVFEDGAANLRDIEIGYTDGDRMEILKGLSPDEVVISVGHEGLRDGAAVRVVGQSGKTMAANPNQAVAMDTERPAVNGGDQGESANQGGRQGRQGAAAQGGRFDTQSPEQFKRFEERMLQIPEIKAEYDKKVKEDPSFKDDIEKKREFFRELGRERFRGRRGQ